jgi:hypothetical protein
MSNGDQTNRELTTANEQHMRDIVSLKDYVDTLYGFGCSKNADLKELMTQRFIDSDRAVQNALASAKDAVSKAETATEKRFDSVNEFRAQLNDQTVNLLTRREYEDAHANLLDKIQALTDRFNTSQGQGIGSDITKSDIYRALAIAVSVIGLIVALVHYGVK